MKNDNDRLNQYTWVNDAIDISDHYHNAIGVRFDHDSKLRFSDMDEVRRFRKSVNRHHFNKERPKKFGEEDGVKGSGGLIEGKHENNGVAESVPLSQHHKIPGKLIREHLVEHTKNMTDVQFQSYFENYINDSNNRATMDQLLDGLDRNDWENKMNNMKIEDRMNKLYISIYWNQANIKAGPTPENRADDPSQNKQLDKANQGYDFAVMADEEKQFLKATMSSYDILGRLTKLGEISNRIGTGVWDRDSSSNLFRFREDTSRIGGNPSLRDLMRKGNDDTRSFNLNTGNIDP